ncbi:MAG: hypothetical protein IT378_13125 [Sandaracinaceae bacterium]|nr:hypothetical protein [Sandaracinaceae bacterium]
MGKTERDGDEAPIERISGVVPRSPVRDLSLPLLHRSFAVATYGPMTISLWDGAVRRDRVEQVILAAREQCRRHPKGGGFTILVERNTGLPEIEVRGYVSNALAEMSRFIHAAAVVIEGEGFLAATARSVVNLVFLAARSPIPVRVFGTVEEAARWQARELRVQPPIDTPELARALREVRRLHAAHRAETTR